MKKCIILQERVCSEFKNPIIQGTMLMFNGQREGKDTQKYLILVKNSALVVIRNCKNKPHSDMLMGAYNSAP